MSWQNRNPLSVMLLKTATLLMKMLSTPLIYALAPFPHARAYCPENFDKTDVSFTDLYAVCDYETFSQRLLSKQGLILIVGPTGSGKTTTIYASLDQLNQDFCSILTLENPLSTK